MTYCAKMGGPSQSCESKENNFQSDNFRKVKRSSSCCLLETLPSYLFLMICCSDISKSGRGLDMSELWYYFQVIVFTTDKFK